MAAFSKHPLSGSTNGRPIEIIATGSPGTTLHTVGATATSARDMVYLWAVNSSASDMDINLELGGTATTDVCTIEITKQDGPVLICPGIAFTGTSSIFRAWATATGGLKVVGYVNRVA